MADTPAVTRAGSGPGAVRIRPMHWWELGTVAAADARIFGATAWTLSYYWAVKAQPGTVMFIAEFSPDGTAAGEIPAASAGERPPADVSAGDDLQASASAGKFAEAEDLSEAEVTEETLAGWIVMSSAGQEADVMTVATTEQARGRGIGRALIAAGLDWVRERGAHMVHLEVDSANAAAIGLYTALGFKEWGRRPDYYPGSDAILMRLRVTGRPRRSRSAPDR